MDDRNEEVGYKEAEAAHFEECTHSNVDGEARWLKKGGQSHYGCKRHTATDENGLILAEVTTPANQSDIKNLNSPLDKLDLPQDTLVLADKGYRFPSISNKRKIGLQKYPFRTKNSKSRDIPNKIVQSEKKNGLDNFIRGFCRGLFYSLVEFMLPLQGFEKTTPRTTTICPKG